MRLKAKTAKTGLTLTREEPDLDKVRSPFGCINTATIFIEASSIGQGIVSTYAAACVVALTRGVD